MEKKYKPSQTPIKIKKKLYIKDLEHIITTKQADQLVEQKDAVYIPSGVRPDRNIRLLNVPGVTMYERINANPAYYKDVGKDCYDVNKLFLEEQ